MLPKMTREGILFKIPLSPSHVRFGGEFAGEFPADWVNLPVLFLKVKDYLGNNAIRRTKEGLHLDFSKPAACRITFGGGDTHNCIISSAVKTGLTFATQLGY